MRLEIELIPESTWHISLANLLSRPIWDTLRREVYSKASYICEICYATDCRVNCHEVWAWNDKTSVQTLKKLVCLCDDCHYIIHWGGTVQQVHEGKLSGDTLGRLTDHFCKVNKCTKKDFERYKVLIGNRQQKRAGKKYKVDFGKFHPDRVTEIWVQENKGKRL